MEEDDKKNENPPTGGQAPEGGGPPGGGRRVTNESIIILRDFDVHGPPEQFPHAIKGHYKTGQTISRPAGAETGFPAKGLAEKVGGK